MANSLLKAKNAFKKTLQVGFLLCCSTACTGTPLPWMCWLTQNHGSIGVRRGLWRSCSPTLLLTQVPYGRLHRKVSRWVLLCQLLCTGVFPVLVPAVPRSHAQPLYN